MKLLWDEAGDRLYETGVRQGVLYPRAEDGSYPLGVAWNGLSSISESPSGAEASPIYADDTKYLNLVSAEEFGATVEAYTYPDEFGECDGSAEVATGVFIGQQSRKSFGLAYRTALGNDVDGEAYGYKLHLIYGALAAPSEKAYSSINDSPEAITFSWEMSTIPVAVAGYKPSATLIIDSTKVNAQTLATLEDMLYGTANADAYLPLPDAVAALFAAADPSAVALSSISPLDDAIDVAINANVVLTFNNAIAREAVILTDELGIIVPAGKSWDTARKVLTINPTGNLVNSETYLVTIGGVVDIYNQILAELVKNFETVAV